MTQLAKLLDELRECRGRFDFAKFERICLLLGYEYVTTGKTGGSRRRMHHAGVDHTLSFHAPHEKEMGVGTIKALRQGMIDKGLL